MRHAGQNNTQKIADYMSHLYITGTVCASFRALATVDKLDSLNISHRDPLGCFPFSL
jgi:hypothetical protein